MTVFLHYFTLLLYIFIFLFLFFHATFKYLYVISSFFHHLYAVRPTAFPTCAIVILSHNEGSIVEGTLTHCLSLRYPNHIVILCDDSDDINIFNKRSATAALFGCSLHTCPHFLDSSAQVDRFWYSDHLVIFQRRRNIGLKAGSLNIALDYVANNGIKYFYVLDCDWHPDPDALFNTVSILEANPQAAYVQTRRLSTFDLSPFPSSYYSLMEDACYLVDLKGRSSLGHPVLFTGSCALLRTDAIVSIDGFSLNHLTEDLDLSNRLWLAGWVGLYDADTRNYGTVPICHTDFLRQQERWAYGSADCLRRYSPDILLSGRLSLMKKLAIFRQNVYFSSSLVVIFLLFVNLVVANFIVFTSISNSFVTYIDNYSLIIIIMTLYCLGSIFSNLIITITRTGNKYHLRDAALCFWFSMSAIFIHALGSIKGFSRAKLNWVCTPKYINTTTSSKRRNNKATKFCHSIILFLLLLHYFVNGIVLGYVDVFSIMWIPALFITMTVD